MARFQPGPGLNARVAARFAVPAVRHIADQLAERMRANAPDARAWITAQDERVRPTHRDADGQTIPANLRYAIDKPTGGAELARAPRDQNLSPANRLNCRCIDVLLPGAVADTVSVSDVTLRRSAASATVSVHFPRIVESEHPDASDGGGGWVARSITEAAGGAGRSN